MLPSWSVEEVILSCTDGTCHWIILSYDCKGFVSDLPIFPLDSNVMKRAFALFHGSSFGGYSGTRDLMDNLSNIPMLPLANLMDQARAALQSMRRASGNPLLESFRHSDFQYQPYHHNGLELYTCCAPTKLPGIEMNQAKECYFRDKVAALMGGNLIARGDDGMVWTFQKERSLNFFLLCLIITCSSSQHFSDLHRLARTKFLRRLRQSNMGGKANSPWNSGEKKRFVTAFVNAKDLEKVQKDRKFVPVPYFFLIGHRNNDQSQNAWKVKHDFSIVIPDIPFIHRHFAGSQGRRPLRKDTKGRAMYIRPAQATECYFVQEPPQPPPVIADFAAI